MNDLLLVADNQQLALMAFLNLSAAFDTVDNSMLLLRLLQSTNMIVEYNLENKFLKG